MRWSGSVGFGRLYPHREALQTQSFRNGAWLPFGDDRMGTFWLCALSASGSNWFTSWEHDSGTELGEPLFADLSDFLRSEYERRLSTRPGASDRGAGDQGLLVKLADAREGEAALDRLRTAGVTGHLEMSFF